MSSESFRTVLRSYARKADPSKLPPNLYFEHNDRSLTIFDCYPKSKFHFLILPRPRPPLVGDQLDTLKSLLHADKEQAREVLRGLGEDAKQLRDQIEQEMLNRYKFKWDIWTGFHAVQSLVHLHLHVISADLCSPAMKNKKHYNSFHPGRGFFLHLDDVMSWFDAEPSFWKQKIALKASTYEPLLKEPLECFHCHEEFKNIPLLKEHLEQEFKKIRDRERAKLEKKRKFLASRKARELTGSKESVTSGAEANQDKDASGSPARKRARTEETEESEVATTSTTDTPTHED